MEAAAASEICWRGDDGGETLEAAGAAAVGQGPGDLRDRRQPRIEHEELLQRPGDIPFGFDGRELHDSGIPVSPLRA